MVYFGAGKLVWMVEYAEILVVVVVVIMATYNKLFSLFTFMMNSVMESLLHLFLLGLSLSLFLSYLISLAILLIYLDAVREIIESKRPCFRG